MKQSALIKGLIVFSISDGREIGHVRDIIINADQKTVDYLLVDKDQGFIGAYVIPFPSIEGIGDDAVMVFEASAIKKIDEVPGALTLVEKGIKLIDSRVLTNKGTVVGCVSEVIVDEDNGRVAGVEYTGLDNNRVNINVENCITFGKDALVVKLAADSLNKSRIDAQTTKELTSERKLNEEPSQAPPTTIAEEPKNAIVPEIDADTNIIEPASTIADEQMQSEDAKAIAEPSAAAKLFEQRQREYLLGKVANKSITDSDGNTIVEKGEIITEEVIEKVSKAGKFRELVLNV